MYRPRTLWTGAFMLTITVQAMIVLALESYIFAKFQMSLIKGRPSISLVKTIPTYLTLFIFGFLYELVLVYDSLRLKNTIQVIGLCMYNLGMLIYASIQYGQIEKAIGELVAYTPDYILPNNDIWSVIRPYLLAVPCIIAFFSIIMSVEAWKLYDEFAWTIYKHISADLRMKRRYLTFQIYIALLKFDFFFFLGFTVQFLVIVNNIADAEKWVTVAAIPVTIVILLMTAYWTRRENKPGMLFTIALFFGGLAWFIFKLERMYQVGWEDDYMPIRKSLTSFAVLTIILIILTIVNACVCVNNFDKGLKPHVMKRKILSDEEKSDNMTELPDFANGPVPSRMTIE